MKIQVALKLVADELDRAIDHHAPMHSTHEGYAVILEEVDELWEEVKTGNGTTHRGVSEAVQVAAMAVRFLLDLCPEESAVAHDVKARSFSPDGGWGGSGGYSG